MSRLPDPDPATLPEAARRGLERMPDLGIFRALANAPEALVPFRRFTGALWKDSALEPAPRELDLEVDAPGAEALFGDRGER